MDEDLIGNADLATNSKRWRDRARRMRVWAEAVNDSDARQIMLRIAAEYDELERLARAKSEDKPNAA